MRIAIASGKGGAGKTTVTASLASVWDRPFIAVDTDVEAPNLHLFLPPAVETSETVGLEVPILDPERCTLCGACRAICRYKAIAQFASRLTIFTDMCHGCGGCFAVCPSQALTPGSRELGVLDQGTVLEGRGRFLMGRSRIGEAMTPPLLRALRKKLDLMLTAIPADALIDSPPGVRRRPAGGRAHAVRIPRFPAGASGFPADRKARGRNHEPGRHAGQCRGRRRAARVLRGTGPSRARRAAL